MNRPHPASQVLASVLFAGALAITGCGKSDHAAEEHEEAHKTGRHGGAFVELSDEAIRSAGIVVGTAGPQPIEVVVELPGEIKLNAERSVDVRPTYAGRVVSLRASLGSAVSRGQPVAVIYSNESLSEYVVSAPMTGTVVARPVNPGSVVDHESVLYTVADLSSVWLDLPIYVQHLGRIRRGQVVRVRTEGGPSIAATGTIDYVGPLLDVDTRTTYARVVLSNPDGRWQPGRLVTAIVVLERVTALVAAPEDAIVRVGTGSAVFRADSSGFEVQPVTVGRSDGTTTEIVSGLERGARVVVKGAFWLKAELEKEAGGHED
jgi:membrane fusion protein, heavy metal efflux system